MLKQICISFAFPMFALAQALYASEKPMVEPTIFGKGIISGGDFDSHPAFTPDGRNAGKVPERGEWIGRHLSDRSLRTAARRQD
jgi:hypothetical protein